MAHQIDTVVMDKTGTITEGHPQVTTVQPIGRSEQELLAAAAGLEQGSEHPLAGAVIDYAKLRGIEPLPMQEFQAVFGRGVRGVSEGHHWYAGSQAFMEENGISIREILSELERLADEGQTPLIVACDTAVAGLIGAADVEKPTSATAIRAFRQMGIDVIMLTGDHERTAEAVRRRLAVPRVIAGVLPQYKARHIAALQAGGHRVAMIGDGVNDAPALAQADLGIAIGAGTDVAIDSADAVLLRSDLLDAVYAIKLSKAVIRNIRENLFWAFFYNVIGIPLAAGVLYTAWGIKLSPIVGAAAMSLSSVCVCLNALRLRRFNPALPASAGDQVIAATCEKEKIQMEKTLKIEGMMCAHCQKHVTEALSGMAGVTSVEVNLAEGSAAVRAERDIPQAEFAQVITAAGYELVG